MLTFSAIYYSTSHHCEFILEASCIITIQISFLCSVTQADKKALFIHILLRTSLPKAHGNSEEIKQGVNETMKNGEKNNYIHMYGCMYEGVKKCMMRMMIIWMNDSVNE